MPGEDLIALAAVFAGLAVIVPLALTHGMHQANEVSEAWRRLAERHRLRFDTGSRIVSKTSVTGALGGHEFLLKRAGGGNNKQSVYMELALNGELPAGLRLRAGKPGPEALAAVLGMPLDVEGRGSGDVSIDERLKVRATDPEDIPVYLTNARKKAALLLTDLGGELDGRKLRIAVTKTAADLEELDKTAVALAELAAVLDTA